MDITEILVAPGRYNFVELWDEVDEADRQIVEVFAFGTFDSYIRHGSQLPPLTGPMANKLLQLLVLSFLNQHENSTVLLVQVLEANGIGKGLEWLALSSTTSTNDDTTTIEIDDILSTMVRENAIDVLIDHENDGVVVRAAKVLRDAYVPQTHQLQVLLPDDIGDRSLLNALGILRHWHVHLIEETAMEFQGKSDPQTMNPRKRKSQVLGLYS